MNARAAALAVAVHIAALLAVLPLRCTSKPPPKPPAPPPRTESASVTFVRVLPGGSLTCDRSYLGIGVTTSVLGRVWDVAPGSPAERAFIREGDYIENIDEFSPNTLAEGTEITLLVRRDTVTTAKPLRIGRVCYR